MGYPVGNGVNRNTHPQDIRLLKIKPEISLLGYPVLIFYWPKFCILGYLVGLRINSKFPNCLYKQQR